MSFYEELLALEKAQDEVPPNVAVPQPDSQGGLYEMLLRLDEQAKTPQATSPAASHLATDPSGLGRSGIFGLPIPPSKQEEVAVQQYSNPNTIVKEKAEKLISDRSIFDSEGSGFDEKSGMELAKKYPLTMPKPINPPQPGEPTTRSQEGAFQAWVWHPELNDWKKHSGSRHPDSGMLLKGRGHKTFQKTVDAERKLGNEIIKREDGRYYSQAKLKLHEWTGERTSEGRKIYFNNRITPDGKRGKSSEYTISVTDSRINNGEETHIPSIYNGYIVDPKTAIDIIVANNGHDPETGRFITPGGDPSSRSEALKPSRLGAIDFSSLNLAIGLNQLKKGFGGLVDYLGADWAGEYLKKSADERLKELESLFTKADLKTMKTPLFVDDPDGFFKIKINPDGTMRGWWGKIVQQTPNLAASIGTGAGFSKAGFALGKKVIGKKVSEKALTKISGGTGFGASEGAIELGFAKAEVEDAVNQAPIEILKTAPRFQEIYKDLISKEFSPGDAEREAKLLLADELSQKAATKVGITTGLIGAPFGVWLAHVWKYKPDSVFKRALVGFVGEGGQEFAQTGVGGVIKEVAKSDAGLPMKKGMDIYKESVEAASTGGPMGSGVGIVAGAGQTDAQRVGGALNELVEGSEFVEGEALKQATEAYAPADATITLEQSPEAIPQQPLQTDEELRQTRRDRKAEEAEAKKKANKSEASQKFKQKRKTAKGRAEAKERKAGREGVEEGELKVPSNISEEYRDDDEIREDFQRLDEEVKQAKKDGKPLSEQSELKIQLEKVRIEGKENRVRKLESEGKLNKARRAKTRIKEIEKRIESLERGQRIRKRNEAKETRAEESAEARRKYKEEQRLERLTRPDSEKTEEEPIVEEPIVEEPVVEETEVEETPKKTRVEEIQEKIDLTKQEKQDKEELFEAVTGYTTLEALANTQSDKYKTETVEIPGSKSFNRRTKGRKLNNKKDSKKWLVKLAKRHKIPYSNKQGTLSNEEIAQNIADHIQKKYGIKLKSIGVEKKKNKGEPNVRQGLGGTANFALDLDEFSSMYGEGTVESIRAGTNNKVGLFAREGNTKKILLTPDSFGEWLAEGGFVPLEENQTQATPEQVQEVIERLSEGDPVFSLSAELEVEAEDADVQEDQYTAELESELEEAKIEQDEKDSLSDEEYEDLQLKAMDGELTEAEQEKLGKADNARTRLSGEDEVMFFMGTGAVVNAAKKLMKGYSKRASKVYDWLSGKASPLSALGDLPNQDRFLRLRDKLGGRLQAVDKIAKDVFKALNNAPEADKLAILEFLTNKGANATMIVDPEARKVAVRVKKTLEAAGKQLVAKGLLSEEAFENYRGAYLPRLYMAHLIKGDLDSKGMITLPNGKKTSNFGFLKPRKEIPQEIRDTILGEIKNVGFLAAKGLHTELRDIAILDTLDKIATNPDWVLPESVAMWPVKKDGSVAENATPWSTFFLKAKANDLRVEADRLRREVESMENVEDFELSETKEKEISRLKKRAERLSETAERMEQAIEEAEPGMQQISLEGLPAEAIKRLGKKASAAEIKREANRLREQAEMEEFQGSRGERMNELADRLDALVDPILKPRNAKDYKTVPDNERYGALRGVQLHKEIYTDFIDTMETTNNILEYAEKVHQTWKLSKVALNPPTQFRNFASNMILLNLSGVSIPRLLKGFYSFAAQTDKWKNAGKVAQRGGIGKSTFSSQEMNLLQEEFLKIEKQDVGQLGKLWLMIEAFSKKGIRGASELYGGIEAFGKTIKIMDELEKGKSTEEAIREANKWLFDYSLVPKTVRQLRKLPVGVPFLTFYYKAFPRMVEAMIKTPWRFAPYIALYMFQSARFKDEHDIDDEDYEKLTKYALPEYLKDKPGVVPLVDRDKNGKWQFIDVSYLYPWSQYTQFYNIGFKAIKEGKFFELDTARRLSNTMGLFGGPLPTYLTGLTTGTDPFTGKKIVREGSRPSEKTAQTLAWMYNVMAPPWLNYGPQGSPQQFKGVLQKILEAWQGKNVNPYTGEPKQTMSQATARFFGLNIYPIDYQQSVSFNLRRIEGEITATRKNALRIMRDPNLSKEQKEIAKGQYKEYLRQLEEEGKEYLKGATLSRRAKRKLYSKRKR